MEESEDGIEDIAWWVVSRGSNYYRQVIDDLSILPYHSEDVSDDGTLRSVAAEIYEERSGYHLNSVVASRTTQIVIQPFGAELAVHRSPRGKAMGL